MVHFTLLDLDLDSVETATPSLPTSPSAT